MARMDEQPTFFIAVKVGVSDIVGVHRMRVWTPAGEGTRRNHARNPNIYDPNPHAVVVVIWEALWSNQQRDVGNRDWEDGDAHNSLEWPNWAPFPTQNFYPPLYLSPFSFQELSMSPPQLWIFTQFLFLEAVLELSFDVTPVALTPETRIFPVPMPPSDLS